MDRNSSLGVIRLPSIIGSLMVGSDRLISGILDQATVALQLNQTQKVYAETSYKAITGWLADEKSEIRGYNPWLFPQGSLAQDTTVKPIASAQFDLDIICHIELSKSRSPEEVYNLIWDRMADHEKYAQMMNDMPRCIRLDYAEDAQFHLDIVPAIPDRERGGDFILIPDGSGGRDEMEWRTSNPVGFKKWLEDRKVVVFAEERKARIDPLESPLPAEQKAALTKSIQLLKRWRDVRWEAEPKLATPSIVLTYLAASNYNGTDSLASTFDNMLDGLIRFAGTGVRKIYNPVNDQEIISEKWIKSRDSHDSFVEAVGQLRTQWDEVIEIAGDSKLGLSALSEKMKKIFGEPITGAVKAALHDPVEQSRVAGSLHVEKKTTRLVPASISPIARPSHTPYRTQTFYGD